MPNLMQNLNYPIVPTLTGDLELVTDTQAIAVSRVRLLIDVLQKERVFDPDYGLMISPFNTSNADFEEAIINDQIQKYCLDGLFFKNPKVSILYDLELDDLKYTLDFRP